MIGRRLRLLPLVLGLALLGGCGTIIDISSKQRVYGGVQSDVGFIADPRMPNDKGGSSYWGFWPVGLLCLFDLPLSLGLDTVLLPVTFTLWIARP
jgi:uncharacterized protein YceK